MDQRRIRFAAILSLITALTLVASGWMFFRHFETHLTLAYQRQIENQARATSERLRMHLDEITDQVDRVTRQLYKASAAGERISATRINSLMDQLPRSLRDQIIGVTILHRDKAVGKYTRLSSTQSALFELRNDLHADNHANTIYFAQHEKSAEAGSDKTRGVWRLHRRQDKNGYVLDLHASAFRAFFPTTPWNMAYLVDPEGRLLIQSTENYFTFGEDLRHLPIVRETRTLDAPAGFIEFYELPGESPQLAAFQAVEGWHQVYVVAQTSKNAVVEATASLRGGFWAIFGMGVFGSFILFLWITFGAFPQRRDRQALTASSPTISSLPDFNENEAEISSEEDLAA